MSTYFISRHPGAYEWAKRHHVAFDQCLTHLDISTIQSGDVVIGSLPVNLAAEVCARGAVYQHLSLKVTAQDRGRELSADDLDAYTAVLERYSIVRETL